MNDDQWQRILSLRQQRLASDGSASGDRTSPFSDLYRPIAMRRGRFVLAQVGQSLDGRVATPSGDAKDVSGCDGIEHLHRCRALVDAVIVGVGTVVADNPSLSVRAVAGSSPVRVVIDCNGRMPLDAKMLHDGGAPVIIVQASDVVSRCPEHETVRIGRQSNGELAPADILAALGERGLKSVLVEGGATTIARFMDKGLIDRLHVSIAPIIIGSGPAGINLPPIDLLSDAKRPSVTVHNIGTDIVFDCDLRAGDTAASLENRDEIPVPYPA
ncbi:RibD family protein [Aliirhizobium terrae]|uniref:RibD family protein n=1 Tax=Terrirhizobium terrae TaxID=2926709 RepID=UPI002578FD5C|nr:RibD family protein [Rhizobium sp. CC-CFT758]WJH41580.1 RibD family protein [Rhizobium sp. CC-CFT758]